MRRFVIASVFCFLLIRVYSQSSLPLNTIVTENFNSMSSSATASLPANWKMSSAGTGLTSGWTTGTNITATAQAANSGLPVNGGAYNWATTSNTDRAVGFLTTASYASPNAIMAYYRNTTGGSVSSVTIAYGIERYVVNTTVPTVDLYYSTNGTSWTLVNGVSTSATDFPTGAAAGSFTTPKTINKTATINVALANNSDIYFKWVFITSNANSQGLGLDNVSVFVGTATPVVIATLQDLLQVDNGTHNQFNEGDVIRYKTVIKNTGTGDANNVQVTLPTPPANTTMVAGSIKTSALAVDDSYAASFNTLLNISVVGQGVLSNDVGIPTPIAVLSYGTTADATVLAPGAGGTTDAGGAITLNANGTFTYTPPAGFSGTDKFKYITGNGNLPNNDAIVTITVAADITFTTTNVDPLCNGGSNGSITFNASGGNGTLQYSITGAAGTYQSSNLFSGLSAGTYNLAVKDAGGLIKTGTATLNNPLALVVNGTTPVNIVYNTAMATVTYTRTNGNGASTWSATGLPTGLSINASTGDLTGTPTVTGSFSAMINVSDVNGCTGSKSVTINVAPKLTNDSYTAVGNTQLVANGHSTPTTPFTTDGTNILGNDQSNAAITVTAGTFATANGGSITVASDGKFIFTPKNGSTTADSYTYTATSNGVSATATINFTVSNMIWYVNNTVAGGNGSSNSPYQDLTAASTAAQTGQIIYIHTGSGNTSGNATLKSGQTLRGNGSALSVGALSLSAGTKPTVSGTVTLASSVTVDGFDMNTGTLTAITNAGATVTGANLSVGTVTTSTGGGMALTGTGNSVTMTLQSLTTNGAANAINLTNTAGTVTINGGSLTGGAGAVVNVSGGTVSLTYSGSASQATASQPLVSISGGHATGTILFQTGTLSATNGTGLQFDNADGTYNFNGTNTLNGGDAGIDILNGSSGIFSFPSTTSITNPSGSVITINASTANFTYSGSFSKTSAGGGILVNGETGGTITINGAGTKSLSTSTGNAISLTSNTGATINFSGNNLSLITTSGIGFNATGGGTFSLTGTGNTISSTTGTALNVVNTTIGGSGLNFVSISANGAVNGIVLNNTGSNAGLTVTGDGTTNKNSTGGTIQNITGDGILLTTTLSPSFSHVNIQNTANNGVKGKDVTNFTYNYGTINNSGTASVAGNSNIYFDATSYGTPVGTETNLTGNVSIVGNTLNNAFYHGVNITNYGGTITNLNVSNNTLTSSTALASSNGTGIRIIGFGTATSVSSIVKGNIDNNTILNFPSQGGIALQVGNATSGGPSSGNWGTPSSANVISINGNSITGDPTVKMGTSAILVANAGTGVANVTVSNNGTAANPITNTIGTTIGISVKGSATLQANVSNNYVVSNNGLGSNGIAFGGAAQFGTSDVPTLDVIANNNNISATSGVGLFALMGGCNGKMKVVFQNNVVGASTGAGNRPAIRVDAGNSATDNTIVCATITGNTATGVGSFAPYGIGVRKQGTVSTVNYFAIIGAGGTSAATIQTYLGSVNTGGALVIAGDNFQTVCSF